MLGLSGWMQAGTVNNWATVRNTDMNSCKPSDLHAELLQIFQYFFYSK